MEQSEIINQGKSVDARTLDQILDLYKLTVEMADRISARRATANSFFLAVNSAVVGFVSLLSAVERHTSTSIAPDDFSIVMISLAGVTLSLAWWLLLRSYRDLNSAKFRVINDIEAKFLPVKPFADEWSFLKEDPIKGWRRRYAELGFVERVVPVIFLTLYGVLSVRTVWP